MRRTSPRPLAGAAALGVLLVVACSPGASVDPDPSAGGAHDTLSTGVSPDPGEYAAGLVRATNVVRDEEGVPALVESRCAADEALRRATALVGAPLEHAPLDAVVSACKPADGVAAENLSRAAAVPSAVVDAWMGSYGHRANLLDPTLTEVGVGCVADPSEGSGVLVCAEVFLG